MKTVDDLMRLVDDHCGVYRWATSERIAESRAALRSELEEVVKDHRRYQYLLGLPSGITAASIVNDVPEGVNATIDAAMQQAPEQEG